MHSPLKDSDVPIEVVWRTWVI